MYRKYERIWLALKALSSKPASELAKGVSIKAHPSDHARIIKAVKKEKYNDAGWKLTIYPRISYLSHTISDNTVTFHLRVGITRSIAGNNLGL